MLVPNRVRFRGVPLFVYEGNAVKIVDKYKYLGIWFTELVEWNTTDETIAEAASKAVCTLISWVRTCGGLGFGTFSKLFDSCVQSIMSYGGGVWGIYECV